MVLMLKPRVGLMTLVSSPLIFITIVVFPELSSPLQQQWDRITNTNFRVSKKKREKNKKGLERKRDLHHKNSHFFLFSLDFPDDTKKPHFLCSQQSSKETKKEILSIDQQIGKFDFEIFAEKFWQLIHHLFTFTFNGVVLGNKKNSLFPAFP